MPESDIIPKAMNPSGWASLQKAAQVINQACRDNRGIAVWGHDDIDGIASTAIMLDALRGKAEVIYYIPPKSVTHYGLDREVIDQLLAKGVSLLITVDSGISSLDEAEYAASKGLELIITDHHELPPQLPRALCLLNPKIPEDLRPSPDLAGAGVALYLAAAVDGESSDDWLEKYPNRTAWAALATITDRVPMTSENWHIVRNGLEFIDGNEVIGKLNDLLGISSDQGLSPRIISQTYVGLLSSCISLGFRHETLELLQGDFDSRHWEELYSEEQLWLNRMEDQVAAKTEKALADPNPLKVLADDQIPWSLVGPVAGGVRDRTGHPVIILGRKNGLTAGECRGFEPFDFVAMLNDLKRFFLQHGGHKPAAGFTVIEGREKELIEALRKYGINNQGLILKSKPSEKIDHRLTRLDEIDPVLPEILSRAPYGPVNQPPVCEFENLLLPKYSQPGDRYWLKYLTASQKNQDFVSCTCRCTLDVTHKNNFYLDVLSVKVNNY
ncbi:MAG: DHH family phosphoesterase [Candidatus Edwardsbacteria bacterium]|nr:DHH family phosphoesterase [Candidatus Edwardsbacteria bacterium]MBU1577136.1 DHH family phosphoesterase [Candidatus Edwardsbacteria bacterium]MBU2463786.1 DHH family phosphoesterase [Candidatus Edwardsbacteria bacterium]MBU2593768.1 DHH family phosphoesterase [Candidatus Edwardsbacteria bacterium]